MARSTHLAPAGALPGALAGACLGLGWRFGWRLAGVWLAWLALGLAGAAVGACAIGGVPRCGAVGSTAGLILAAGGGTRYAGPTHKLLADVRGRPLVSFALANVIAAGLDATVVVTGAVDLSAVVPAGVIVVANPAWQDGQATSLAAGVAWARSAGIDAIVVGLGDQPGIQPASWRAVAEATTPIAVATYDNRRGHPVRLGSEVWDLLPTTGDAGAREVMAASPGLVTEVPCAGDAADVDTAEDLIRWR